MYFVSPLERRLKVDSNVNNNFETPQTCPMCDKTRNQNRAKEKS